MEIDIVIVGGGPAGLAFATYASTVAGKRVVLLDANASIGGCHRVERVPLWTEHGPRIYSGAYLNFSTLLDMMGTSFDREFTPYKFTLSHIGNQSIGGLSWAESLSIVGQFARLMLNPAHGRRTSMRAYLDDAQFSPAAVRYVDSLCRLTDGAGIDRYSVSKFLAIFNEQLLYGIYEPRRATDTGFLHTWQTYLERHGVVIVHHARVVSVDVGARNVRTADGRVFGARESIVLAVPPTNVLDMQLGGVQLPFSARDIVDTRYIDYIPIAYHWPDALQLPHQWGFPLSDWGVAYVVMTDYMTFPHSRAVISALITRPDAVSTVLQKTPQQCTRNELIADVFRQLRDAFPDLPSNYRAIVWPDVYRDAHGHWMDRTTAYIKTPTARAWPFQLAAGLFTLGTHTDHSMYSFTSLESAVSNALVLARHMFPRVRQTIAFRKIWTLRDVLLILACTGLAGCGWLAWRARFKQHSTQK